MVLPYNRNPKFNNLINPRINQAINPLGNLNINPNANLNINPNGNLNINPNANLNINPKANYNVNPSANYAINPRVNNAINPRINYSVNPKTNQAFPGFYVFDLSLNAVEFVVKVNSSIIQLFDFDLKNTRFGVAHSLNGYAIFDIKNNYLGHFESDSQKGFNEFDASNVWKNIIK